MLKHTRSISDKVFEVWRVQGRFTKNPDVIALPSDRLMLIYSDTDSHWSQEDQILTLLASDDRGKTWFKHREIDQSDLRKGDERLVTPRLSRLNDGRLVVLVDHNDEGPFSRGTAIRQLGVLERRQRRFMEHTSGDRHSRLRA